MIKKTLGRYNLCSTDPYWCVEVRLPDGTTLGELWEADREPDIEDRPPSEVIELIATRVEEYLLATDRPEKRKKIEWCRCNADLLDRVWAQESAAELERQAGLAIEAASRLRQKYLLERPIDD